VIALRVALAVLVAAALIPEFHRYAAERRLYGVSAVLQLVTTRPRGVPNPAGAVVWAASTAISPSAHIPGDWRPLTFAGSAFLLLGQPDQALDRYRQALELGERPEIDVNIGRAYARQGRSDRAAAAFLRAAWISPAVLAWLPNATGDAVRSELAALEHALIDGRLETPPALPP
jgi:tetratricopeptide (TPR) repeat protein